MIILSHPTGSFFPRTAAKALHQCDLLDEFNTCLSLSENNPLVDLIGGRFKDEYFRRVFREIPDSKKSSHPSREFLRLAFSRTGIITGSEKENHPLSVFSIYKSFDRYVANKLKKSTHATAVYSYEDGALETFIEAKKQGFKCFYELPIGYWKSARAIFEEEKSLNPHWSSTIPGLGIVMKNCEER